MKSYVFVVLIFLVPLSSPQCAFAEEQVSHSDLSHPLSGESQQEESETRGFDHGERHRLWVNPMEKESDSFQTKFFNMLLILGLLVGFMILASLALKRMMRAKITHLNTGSSIKLVETRSLSPRTTLYLVQVQDQTFLIAESPTSMIPLPPAPSSPGASPL